MSKKNLLYSVILLVILLFVNRSSFAEKNTTDSVLNQIVVTYKVNQNPLELQTLVSKRIAKKSSLFGSLQLAFENIAYRIKNEKTPEEKLQQIFDIERQIGVIKKDYNDSGNIYIITINGTVSVTDAVKLYSKLPEVKFAEPNYIYKTLQF